MNRLTLLLMTILFTSAAFAQQPQEQPKKDDFKYLVEQFADLKIMRYQVPRI